MCKTGAKVAQPEKMKVWRTDVMMGSPCSKAKPFLALSTVFRSQANRAIIMIHDVRNM